MIAPRHEPSIGPVRWAAWRLEDRIGIVILAGSLLSEVGSFKFHRRGWRALTGLKKRPAMTSFVCILKLMAEQYARPGYRR